MNGIKSSLISLVIGVTALTLAGCVTVGRSFPAGAVDQINPGTTTIDEIQKLLGNPVRIGQEDGKLVWTYLEYKASLGGAFQGQDLTIKFDTQNRVVSLSYNTTDVSKQMKR
ncbi:MAG TPA: outer membrane protein assembly factor BamE [bacterium]|nr:outer membrane protein assembly factor BamE [bacterium]